MILINTSNKKVLSTQLKIAASFADNTFGLLKENAKTVMLFKTRFGIHTFFMQYPIDILILNNSLKVVQIKKKLAPNRVFFWNPKYACIIELPSSINISVKLGDELKIN